MPQDLPGAPGGGQVWNVGGKTWLAYQDPIGKTWLLWQVWKDDYDSIFGVGEKPKYDKTVKSLKGVTAVKAGNARRIQNTSDNPFQTIREDFETEARVRPWLRDPEVASIVARAVMEGRTPTDAELKGTDWFRDRSEREREWAVKLESDPKTARRETVNRRLEVRDMFWESGYGNVPLSLVDYYSDQFTRGEIDEPELRDAIRRETDPFTPGASPFAGMDLPAGARAVRDERGRQYVEVDGSFWRLTGEGQQAKYGSVYPNALDTVKGVKAEGSLADYFQQSGDASTDDLWQLGGMEDVRSLVSTVLGSHMAERYDEEWMAGWASKIRRNPAEADLLMETLRQQFASLYPGYDSDATYADVSQPWKAEMARWSGNAIQDGDVILEQLIKKNDAQYAQQKLAQEGLKRNWSPTIARHSAALGDAFGSQVRGPV